MRGTPKHGPWCKVLFFMRDKNKVYNLFCVEGYVIFPDPDEGVGIYLRTGLMPLGKLYGMFGDIAFEDLQNRFG